MGKVYESQVDPDEFIRSFREEPSQLSRLKKKSADETASSAPAGKSTDNKDAPTVSVPQNAPVPVTDTAHTEVDVTADEETAFRRKYVANKEASLSLLEIQESTHFLMVDINSDFIRIIKSLLAHENRHLYSVKSYVNNVITEHFKKHEEIIKKILQQQNEQYPQIPNSHHH